MSRLNKPENKSRLIIGISTVYRVLAYAVHNQACRACTAVHRSTNKDSLYTPMIPMIYLADVIFVDEIVASRNM
jgi:hypothetical protein